MPQAAVAGKYPRFVFVSSDGLKCLIRITRTRVHKGRVRPLPLIAGEIHGTTVEGHKEVLM